MYYPSIQQRVNNVANWLKCNRLSLNIKKTQCILYQHIYRENHKNELKIVIDGLPVTLVDRINFLGIFFDEKLIFSFHTAKVRKKISQALGLLNRNKNLIPLGLRRQLYYAFIHPHITYEIWGDSAKMHTNSIISLQKKITKFYLKQ